jgi:hypothetical protein
MHLRNGLLCCKQCDALFDRRRLFIGVDGTISFDSTVSSDPGYQNIYKQLNGKKVPWAKCIDKSTEWPSSTVLLRRLALKRPKRTLNERYQRMMMQAEAGLDVTDSDTESETEEDGEGDGDDIGGTTAAAAPRTTKRKQGSKYEIDLKDAVAALQKLAWLSIRKNQLQLFDDEMDHRTNGQRQLAALGLRAHDVGGGGNCTFHSIADQLEAHGIAENEDHTSLRLIFQRCICSDISIMAQLGITQEEIDAFTEGVWDVNLGDLVIFVLARFFRCNIRVVHGTRRHEFINDPSEGAPLLTVMYTGAHYLSSQPLASMEEEGGKKTKKGSERKSKRRKVPLPRCKYIVSSDSGGRNLYCKNPSVEDGNGYCAEHQAVDDA